MRRTIILSLLVVAGMVSAVVAASQAPAGQDKPKVIEVEKLKDNLFVLRGAGGGGNTAVFVMNAGVTVVDTKNPGWGRPIIDAIRKLTDKPITRIINTHTHGDHVSGNVEFEPTVDVVAHENAAASMKRMKTAAGTNIFDDNKGRGLPKRTYTDHLTIGSGAERIDLHYYGRGHTDGDTWVLFPALRIVHAGDIFSGKNLPLLDTNNGGTGVEIGDTLAKAHAGLAKSVDTIITGHSVQMTPGDLSEYAQFNRDFLAYVQAGKKAGRTMAELVSGWTMPAKYAGYTAPQPERLQQNVERIFNAVK
jgi:glyoxylase-like metal-dependent hydrolase (beta-lactamase superfamily II)